jgi:Ca-activated chloride channel family protein
MTFLWMPALWLMVLIPIAVGLYLYMLRRRKAAAVRYASLSMVKQAMGKGANVRRHLPPALFLAALTLMLLAVARPAAVITLASQRATVMLAMDVSGSMRAQDVEPSRIEAAKVAAKTFIKDMPRDVRIGVVAFAGTAFLVQPPTNVRDDLYVAIDRLELQRGTATGSGIFSSLQTIFPDYEFDLGEPRWGRGDPWGGGGGSPLGAEEDANRQGGKQPPPPAVPPGSYPSAVIIVMTDGQTTTGPEPVDAARLAADRGVRVFTVGFGSPDGEVVGYGGWSMRSQLDEESLKSVADLTRGQYFRATSAQELKNTYQGLNRQLVKERRETEITAFFSAAAAALAMLAAGLSMLWFNRVF